MKKLLLLLLSAFVSLSFTVLAENGVQLEENKPLFDQTTGLAALDFEIVLTDIKPDNFGFYSTTEHSKLVIQQQKYHANEWLILQTKNLEVQESLPSGNFSLLPHQQTVSAKLSVGRFSAITSIDGSQQSLLSDSRLQLSSSFELVEKNKFTLSVTAQIEQANNHVVDMYMGYTNFAKSNESVFSQDITNTSFGLVGTYKFTPNWKISGGVSSTHLDSSIKQSPLVSSGSLKIAELKTSYSF